jgi:hypothetical protein
MKNKFNYSNKLNNTIIPGKINFLLDAAQGSSGKGSLEAFLVKNTDYSFILTSNSANASHTVTDTNSNGEKVEIVFKALPSGSLYHDKLEKIFITSGASFELESLFKEIEFCGIPRSKVRISSRAAVIQKIDIDFEKGLCDLDGNYYSEEDLRDGTIKTGTTASGSGAVLAKKAVRNKTLVTAKDIKEISDMVCVVEEEILDLLSKGKSGLYSIGQGFPLSNNYWRFAPYTTSRNVTVSSALNDGFLPPSVVGNVFLNDRTYPIRIASYKLISKSESINSYSIEELYKNHFGENLPEDSDSISEKIAQLIKPIANEYPPDYFEIIIRDKFIYVTSRPNIHLTKPLIDRYPSIPYNKVDSYSGDFFPDSKEITWEALQEENGIIIKESAILTSLTKLPRRVATYSSINLDEAIKYNQTIHKIYIHMNFMNWIDPDMEGVTDFVSQKCYRWLDQFVKPVMEKYNNVYLFGLGTSEFVDSKVIFDN